ncbi:PAP2 superfamily-domain-containing protein [Gloeopeniophorella convolvens]|nr:PAP2 superfamily-domain-containing protein [Gloeopeniophorella convolvens]
MASAPPLIQPFTDDSHLDDGGSVIGLFLEPLIVVSLLTAGVLLNRRPASPTSRSHSPLLAPSSPPSQTRHSSLRLFKPRDTSRYADNWISRTVFRYPFLLEVLYWALTYWVYQVARAISAVLFIDEGTVDTARRHAIQLLEFERHLGIQWENKIQDTIMQHGWAIASLNRIYSFIHIPATIAFLAYFYHAQPFRVYAPVRRTMALANLLAFVVFTLWPCMPPRLLPASYGFVDTVHKNGMGSVWTTNKFCNQFAAMPSLHFGYSLIVGVSLFAHAPASQRRGNAHVLFLLYPATILLAIVATANHYLLDAVAGLVVAAVARYFNTVLIPLLALENVVFNLLHIHKPPPASIAEGHQDTLPRFAEDANKQLDA